MNLGEMRQTGVPVSWSIALTTIAAIAGHSAPIAGPTPRFVCAARAASEGAEVRPDFNWNRTPVAAMGYR